MKKIVALCALTMLASCGSATPSSEHAQPSSRSTPCTPGVTDTTGDDLSISLECIAPGLWMYTALAPADFELPGFPANGLVIEESDHAILVDTAWSDAQADALVRWSALPIAAAVVTHFHHDRTGGAHALITRGIPVLATARTIALATERGEPVPEYELSERSLPELRWYYPGAAHSPDNIVVWHEPSRTLFGGCMIKELAAESLGNVADADLTSWVSALDAIEQTFGAPAIVVPGHGARGDASLLAHTRDLLTPR